MQTNETRKQVMVEEVDRTVKLMIQGELMAGNYKRMTGLERDVKRKAALEMKVQQLDLAAEFNSGYIEYVGTQLAKLETKPKKK